jgi:uncharacterized delta-60 repeat protein
MRIGTASVAVVVAALLLPPAAQAAAGKLDPTFSGDGRQTTAFGSGNSAAAAIAIQPDGKIVAIGSASANAPNSTGFALARYKPNGSLDTTFSGDGRQTTPFAGSAYAVAIQPDGKIVVVGTAGASGLLPGNFAIARYKRDGSLDPTFSGDGKQTTDFGGYDVANAVALMPNGKIVAAGGGAGSFAVARYTTNGSLDTSFSRDGKRLTNFKGVDQANGVVLQGDGKIVAAGYTAKRPRGAADFALARYNRFGSLDKSFSGDGKQTTHFADGDDQAYGVAIQSDGRIVAVGGGSGYYYASNFALARYRVNGSLDPTFSGDGRQTTDFGGFVDAAYELAIQPDGKIVAVGEDGSSFAFGLARYRPNGSLDPTFSGDGKQSTSFPSHDAGAANGVALQANGKIVAAGVAGDDSGTSFALARYLGG